MWLFFMIIAAVVFAAAAIISPLAWFMVPAVLLFAVGLAGVLGLFGAAQEETRVQEGPDPTAEPDSAGRAHVGTGYAHEGQAPGH
jgi:hypothetical protein